MPTQERTGLENLEGYKKDLEALEHQGFELHLAMEFACYPSQFEKIYRKKLGEKYEAFVQNMANFEQEYQSWYSEAKALIRQLLPDRLDDFAGHYEKPKPRKEITYESYRIEDYMQGLVVKVGGEQTVGPDAAVSHFRQQRAIVKAVSRRFESTLFDIRQLVQADLFDSELDAASELLKNGFVRAAGAVAGVVLEKHLGQVCENHQIKQRKKSPTIADFNDSLKKDSVIDTPQWRSIQHLGDIRNLCDHNKDREPTNEEVAALITGADRLVKTLF